MHEVHINSGQKLDEHLSQWSEEEQWLQKKQAMEKEEGKATSL